MAGQQYLTFKLGREQYAVPILRVQEIKGYSKATPIPNTPPYAKGVINLRGAIVPVVDLRCRLGMSEIARTRFTAVIVVTAGAKTTGLIVDEVTDVLDVQDADVQDTPDFGAAAQTRFIAGLARAGDRLVVLLELDTILHDDAVAMSQSA